MTTFRIVVKGMVQGVGFRAFVYDLAKRMNIRGEVWNRKDGGVEILAQHESREELEEFIENLYLGPGRVDDVRFEEEESKKTFENFRIVFR
ncbi:MAG TPA: acylphosphatase [Fimbriimonadales bacterium]|nr:acylphosphatase [Fimbriimonadales bacterium]